MRLLSYRHDGRQRLGARVDGVVIDLEAASAGALPSDMVAFLQRGAEGMATAREVIDSAAGRADVTVDAATVELLPVVPRPPKIVCVARNYGAHAAEAGLDVLEVPNLFIRFPQSLVAAGAPVLVPKVSEQVDWEAELAVVVGRTGKHIRAEHAYDHVAGYTLFNDVSIRDWQLRKPPVQFGAGKNFDGSGPLGPELVTRDEVADPHALDIRCLVNGEIMQSSNTKDMIFDIPTLVAHISAFTTLEPGDVIATGTPSGVGHFREPPVYLKAGDTVTVAIDGIGALSNPVEDEA